MTQPRELHCYQYVNQPYARVRALLRAHTSDILQRATRSANARADALSSTLRITSGPLEIGVEVGIHVVRIDDEQGIAGLPPVTRIQLTWKAVRATALFPSMDAQLSFWPLTAEETRLELDGVYQPPFGVAGNAVDALVGHRVAEASVHRFLEDVGEQLRRDAVAA